MGGATASGKSSFALALAQNCGGAIINADSMQMYGAIPTLTAHPSLEDQARAPHHLYGVLGLQDKCNVAHWHQRVCDTIDACHAQGIVPIVVGGTGLYLGTLTQGLAYVPEIDPAIRQEARNICEVHGTPALYEALQALDPDALALNPNDTHRVARAYEVVKSTGRPLGYWHTQQDTARIQGYVISKIFITRPRTDLDQRMTRRLNIMLKSGVIEEVQALLAQDFARDHPLRKALGVPEIAAFLSGSLPRALLRDQILVSTRQYAKRQRTWFKRAFADACLNPKIEDLDLDRICEA